MLDEMAIRETKDTLKSITRGEDTEARRKLIQDTRQKDVNVQCLLLSKLKDQARTMDFLTRAMREEEKEQLETYNINRVESSRAFIKSEFRAKRDAAFAEWEPIGAQARALEIPLKYLSAVEDHIYGRRRAEMHECTAADTERRRALNRAKKNCTCSCTKESG